MATFRIRYLTTRPRLNGTVRHYWQPSSDLVAAGWKVQPLSDDPAQARIEAERYNADLDCWREKLGGLPIDTKEGSIEALIENYKNSRRWKILAPKTRISYEYNFRIINKWCGDSPASAMTPKLVQKFYESRQEKTPAKAAGVVRVLRLLLQHGIREDMFSLNAAARPGIRNKAKKGTPWSAEAVAFFMKAADEQGYFSIGTAVKLNEWLGQRKGDIITTPLTAYKGGCLHLKQHKTGAEVVLPVDSVPELKARLDAQLEHNKKAAIPSIVLITGTDGQPYSEYWFTHVFAKIRDKAAEKITAEAAGRGEELQAGHPLYNFDTLIFKDLRHTAVTRLAEAGCPTPMIASITGHSFRTCEEIVDRYNIRTTKMAGEGFRLRLAAEQPKKEGTNNVD